MSYKMKSTLYFFGFLAAITMYYSLEYSPKIDQFTDKTEIAEAALQQTKVISVTPGNMK